MCAPKSDADGVVLQQRPVVCARLCALHVDTGVEVQRVAADGAGIADGAGQEAGVVPVVVEEERRTDMFAIAKGLVVV